MSIKIGVELEVLNVTIAEVREAVEAVGSTFDGYSGYHGQGLATGWKAERDGSLTGASATEHTKGNVEIISRPLKGVAGVREMKIFIDTADVYNGGQSESILGSWIESNPERRQEIILASKVFFQGGRPNPDPNSDPGPIPKP